MTGRYAVIGCKLKQDANEGCNRCATVVQVLQDLFLCFIACFILLVIAYLPLKDSLVSSLMLFADRSTTSRFVVAWNTPCGK